MSAIPNTRRYTVDEYFELDQNSETRYEYVYGYVVAMAGASPEHELIMTNLSREISLNLKVRKLCRIYGSNFRTQIKRDGRYAYPDAVVVCGETKLGRQKTLLNPTVVFEILSDSTKAYDQGDKGADYRKIASLQTTVFISQTKPLVTVLSRQDEGWTLKDYEGLDAVVSLDAIGCTLALVELYDQIDFPPNDEEQTSLNEED